MDIKYCDTKKLSIKTCVALGNFDGVHLGHREIIRSAVEYGKSNGISSCVYTFSSHPTSILGDEKQLITDNNEKASIIASLGCDMLYYEDFLSVRSMSPSEFCKEILAGKLNAACVFCGDNYRFGHMGRGDTTILRNELDSLGIKLVVIPYVKHEDTVISSTEIRKLISGGNVAKASALMGRPYSLSGIVEHGKKLGRIIGFPTLNISVQAAKIKPKFGVYIAECLLRGKKHLAVSNIGTRPTTDENTVHCNKVNCETFLINYAGDAYGETITVYLHEIIRPEKKFVSVDQLKKQISEDVMQTESYFNNTEHA